MIKNLDSTGGIDFANTLYPKMITYLNSLASWYPSTDVAKSMAIPSIATDSFVTPETPRKFFNNKSKMKIINR